MDNGDIVLLLVAGTALLLILSVGVSVYRLFTWVRKHRGPMV